MGMILGAVLILLGVVCQLVFFRERRKLGKIQETPTSTAKQLIQRITSPMKPADAGTTVVEVKGVIRCDQPLRGPISNKECVYFRSTEREKRQNVSYDEDDDGKRKRHVATYFNTLRDETEQVPFWCEDATGRVQVDLTNAEVDGLIAVNRFEPTERWDGKGGMLGSLLGSDVGESILGREIRETILPVGRRIYVLGGVTYRGEGPQICKPSQEGGTFLVSLKSEEDLVSSMDSKSISYLGAGLLLELGGALAFIIGLR